MIESILVPPCGGEIVGDSPDRRVEILSDDKMLHATWSRFGPRREGADLHVHRRHTDLFYVLDGELTVRLGIDDENVVVPAGTLARVPPLVTHGFRNGSDGHVRYLNFHAPGQGFADFMRALRDGHSFAYDQHPPPSDGGRAPTDAVIGGGELVTDRSALPVTVLADVNEIAIAEIRSEPAEPSPPHVHRRHVESFYVLDGELTLRAGGSDFKAEAGTWVQVPLGLPHTLAASGKGTARYLNLHTPSCGFGGYLRRLHEQGTEAAVVESGFDQSPA